MNTVCFADESGHIIYSGSDDGLCKVNLISLFLLKVGGAFEVHIFCIYSVSNQHGLLKNAVYWFMFQCISLEAPKVFFLWRGGGGRAAIISANTDN